MGATDFSGGKMPHRCFKKDIELNLNSFLGLVIVLRPVVDEVDSQPQ